MNKSEAGKLGNIASKATQLSKFKERQNNYYKNPKLCVFCKTPIKYGSVKLFCNHSCSANYHNGNRFPVADKKPKRNREQYWLEKREKQEKTINELIKSGKYSDRPYLKRYIIKYHQNGSKHCSICQLDTWNQKPIPLELDHIDGCASNNLPSNLRVICPNCHAQTPTAKGRNREKGRKSLGLPAN